MDLRYDRVQFPTVFTRESRHHHSHEHHEAASSGQTPERQAENPQPEHSRHGSAGHGGSMVFHVGNRETILFGFWTTSSTTSLVLSCLIVFIIAIGYEALKCYREWLKKCYKKRQEGGSDRGSTMTTQLAASPTLIDAYSSPLSPVVPAGAGADQSQNQAPLTTRVPWLALTHWYQTLLHMLQVTISFLLMLIFMTFNVWLCIAVVLGAGVGYFIFFARSENVSDHCN
ncbi:hypothetical protein AWZ03_001131 [Drosophila navojoa]|uniref:Copper transport protein n=1 Tax=Drosophila navojoa TaxID=7232 RepID=A0A484BWZ9_DRONA|nr:probable low affinity copper uptake protein 2 [Drosophila navojoa]XP_017968263.1 probable low affinity copper uptake protein 2 [Drosophila navojoa]TDG52301.1 hypothetical protein AWZ03_001131 [Drosophila navojoa]